MKKTFIVLSEALLISLLIISLLGSMLLLPIIQNLDASTNSGVQAKVAASWTYMVYLDADNNLDSYGLADINEMEDGYSSAVTGDVNVIVFIDREYSGAKTYRIVEDHTGSIVSPILTTGFPSEPNMGAKDTLKNFMIWVANNYPADKYVLDLWDHGGAVHGICWDDSNSHDKLTFDEVDTAITEVCATHFDKIDIVAADACLMQLLEWCYEIREHVDFSVASEETIPGNGYPYDLMIDRLCDTPSQTAATYASWMVTDYQSGYHSGYDLTLSSIDIASQMTPLMNAFNWFVANLSDIVIPQKSAISSARAATQDFAYSWVADLKDFAVELKSRVVGAQYQDACQEMIDAIDDAVTNNIQYNNPHAYGLAIYFPETTSDLYSWYGTSIDLGQETQWDEFLNDYFFGPTFSLALLTVAYNETPVQQGQTINTSITIKNTGSGSGADAYSVNGTLSCADGNITVQTGVTDYGTIAVGGSTTRNFYFNVSPSVETGYVIWFGFLINATFGTNYLKNETFPLIINVTTILGGDNFDNAEEISEGVFSGLMPGPDPIDNSAWFKINVSKGKFLIVSIILAGSSTDFDIYVYTPSGTFITAAATASYPDTCSAYTPEAGYYRIRIYPYDGSGLYSVNVTISNTTGPEDGLFIGTAFSLSPENPSQQGTLPSTSHSGDLWFRVFLNAGEAISVYLEGDDVQNDFDLYLYNYVLEQTGASEQPGYPEQINVFADYTGYYYFRVTAYSGTGDFLISMEVVPPFFMDPLMLTIIIVVVGICIVGGLYLFFKASR